MEISTAAPWTIWSTGVTWVDVHVGDFNGDGKSDIIGRALETGQWWVALSNGSGFTNSRWDTWSTSVTWVDIQVGDFNGGAVVATLVFFDGYVFEWNEITGRSSPHRVSVPGRPHLR